MPDINLAHVCLVAFSLFNLVRLISYWPQIARIVADRNGATAISYATWSLWTCSHMITCAYALVNVGDRLLGAYNALYALCCVSVITITAWKRRSFANSR